MLCPCPTFLSDSTSPGLLQPFRHPALPCLSDWPFTAYFGLWPVNYFINDPIMSEHTLQPDQVNLLFRHLG